MSKFNREYDISRSLVEIVGRISVFSEVKLTSGNSNCVEKDSAGYIEKFRSEIPPKLDNSANSGDV